VRRFLYETGVFVYALGGPHRYREPCVRLVGLAWTGDLRGEAGTDLVQESSTCACDRSGSARRRSATRTTRRKKVMTGVLVTAGVLAGGIVGPTP